MPSGFWDLRHLILHLLNPGCMLELRLVTREKIVDTARGKAVFPKILGKGTWAWQVCFSKGDLHWKDCSLLGAWTERRRDGYQGSLGRPKTGYWLSMSTTVRQCKFWLVQLQIGRRLGNSLCPAPAFLTGFLHPLITQTPMSYSLPSTARSYLTTVVNLSLFPVAYLKFCLKELSFIFKDSPVSCVMLFQILYSSLMSFDIFSPVYSIKILIPKKDAAENLLCTRHCSRNRDTAMKGWCVLCF